MNTIRSQSSLQRVVVIGAGSIGERHLRCFLSTERVRVAFIEPDDRRRAEMIERYPAATAYATLDPALEVGFDAAVIATPAPLHVPLATQLAEAGMHVLIEKPLAVKLEGVQELLEIVRRRRIVAAVAYVYRAHPALAQMAAAIQSGKLGAAVQLYAVSGQHFPTYRPAYRDTYYASRATGGGAVQDALTHLIDVGQLLVGPITRVVADAAHQVLEGVDVEDTVHVLAHHRNILASYALNQHQTPNETTITVVCERGVARFEYHRNCWMWMQRPDERWHEETAGGIERDGLFLRQANAFLDAISGRGEPFCTLAEGVAALKVNLAVLASAEHRCWQEIA